MTDSEEIERNKIVDKAIEKYKPICNMED